MFLELVVARDARDIAGLMAGLMAGLFLVLIAL